MSTKGDSKGSDSTPWYADGLRFGCTASGRCCSNHGEHAYVYLMEAEVTALADALGMEEAEFRKTHTRQEEGWTLLEPRGTSCVFLGGTGQCGVYEARPVQCRTWPFWRENLASPEAFQALVGSICKGAGSGTLYSAEQVLHIADSTEAWYEGDLDEFPASAQVGTAPEHFPPRQPSGTDGA
jgi:Fe-S-cluster containining protein